METMFLELIAALCHRVSADGFEGSHNNDVVLLLVRSNEIRGVDLNQPFYHTIPTIALPQVAYPTEIDFDSSTNSIYWSESRGNSVKMSTLASGVSTVIIDTGIENPQGFSVDWISKNMFVSSSGHGKINIFACNLQGEYVTNIYENSTTDHGERNNEGTFEEVAVISSLAVDPLRGKIYWVEHWGESSTTIESANMDMTAKLTVTSSQTNMDLKGTRSLSLDFENNHLYWVNVETSTIQCMDLSSRALTKIALDVSERPEALTMYKGALYFLDSTTIKSKKGNEMSQILRNNTDNVTSIKIYNKYSQNGTNACAVNRGGCSHLCLPVTPTSRVCKCSIGYMMDPKDETKCIARDQLLVYSINSEMRGLPLSPNDKDAEVLPPISRVSMATSIDYDPVEDYLYWADSDHGTITRVRRDGTGRRVVVGNPENSDTLAIERLTGLAVDWVAGNIYWANPKQKVIEVARSDGMHRHVVVQRNISSPNSLAVDPYAGKLFWTDDGMKPHMICRADLDGTDAVPIQVLGSAGHAAGLTLNLYDKLVYWCDARRNSIFSMDYNGMNLALLQYAEGLSPYALAYHNKIIYWIDLSGKKGSIKSARATPNATAFTLSSKLGDSLKDLTIISKLHPPYMTNPCEPGKHRCAQLCLFDGTEPVCRCSHGLPSNGSCAPPKAFLAYSLVDRIDTVNLVGDMDHNPPLPSISSELFMRNAIGLTFNYLDETIFYSDIQKGSINAVNFNGTNHRIIAERQESVEGLAYGAIENSLYWTCKNIATIFKMSLSSTNSTPETVIKLLPLDKPRGIAVDVCDSRLYWTNWNNRHPSIQRSFTNGRLMEAIITTDIRLPNAIALDDLSQKLFWADARLDKIERCELDGSDRVVLTDAVPQHPFAMAVYGEYIYWTDWVVRSVLRANKFTGAEAIQLRRDVGRPMGIAAIYNSSFNCFNNPCRVLNGGCSQICRLDAAGAVLCSCNVGMVLEKDGKWCVTPQNDAKACSEADLRHC